MILYIRPVKARTWIPVAQILDCGCLLLLPNLLVFLLVRCSFETLPWQTPSEEVHEHVPQRFQIVSSRLFSAQVGVDAHVTRGARQ